MTEQDIELAGRIRERLESANEPTAGEGNRFEAWSRSAKGVAVSLVVSLVWGMLRMYDFSRGLPALLVALNEAIVMTFHLEKYLTVFFCIVDPETGTLRSAVIYRWRLAPRRAASALDGTGGVR